MPQVAPSRTALVTGTAGFVGFHLARRLLADGWQVTGVDGITPYYDVTLKEARHAILTQMPNFTPHLVMLEDQDALSAAFGDVAPDLVVHLAAQAGVRYSLENPRAYVDSNLVGTFNLMENVRRLKPAHFMLASTSSVYGANENSPFKESDRADYPLTLYAATKKANEAMVHSYSHLWHVPTTAFRFFTVYGPWGRPDMAPFKFVRAALAGEPIEVYGMGQMFRDFTFIDDLIEAVKRLIDTPPVAGQPVGPADSLSPVAPFRTVNIGAGQPVGLMAFIESVERILGREIEKKMLPMQKGDVTGTFASADLLHALTGYRPSTPVEAGMQQFVSWYTDFYGASR